MRDISADLVPALFPEQLALTRNVLSTLEAVFRRIVTFLCEDCSSDAEGRVLREFPEEELEVILVKGNISVQVTKHFIPKTFDSFIAGVESVYLACEVPVLPLRPPHQFYPRMLRKIPAYDITSTVRRSIVHDDPFRW